MSDWLSMEQKVAQTKAEAKALNELIAELEPRFNELMLLVPQPADPEEGTITRQPR